MFDENEGLTPLEKSKFSYFLNRCSNSLERLLFYPEVQQTPFLDVCFIKTKDEKTSTFY